MTVSQMLCHTALALLDQSYCDQWPGFIPAVPLRKHMSSILTSHDVLIEHLSLLVIDPRSPEIAG